MSTLKLSVVLCGLLCVLCAPGWAQVASAELSGTVLDSSGAAVANAKVTATNLATNVARDGVSDGSGRYFITLLPAGDYSVSAEAPGFRKLVQSGLVLQINQQARLDLTLELGHASETVEVTGQAPLLESESSSLGTVVSQKLVNQLPLNGRNFIQLATLSPGVNGVGYSASGTIMSGTRPDDRRPGTEIFSNGNREGSNNFLYDGIDDNERLTLSIVLRPAVEAVREFKIQTNLYSADIGRNSGAVVDVITKSGTNQLHGSLFEFLRNSAMDSRSFFSPKGTAFPTFRLNQFGGSFGGPVVLPKLYNGKDRTFFFVDYEGYRRDSQQLLLGNVPTAKMRAGDFSEAAAIYDPLTTRANPNGSGFIRDRFLNNQIPANRWDPISAKMINAYPLPTGPGRFNNYLANLVQNQKWNQGDVRVDHQISPKDSFFARWSIQNTETTVPSSFPTTTIPGISEPVDLGDEGSFAGTSFQPAQHAVASYIRIINPSLVNEFRVGFNRYRLDYTADQFKPNGQLGNQLGVPNANVTPNEQNLPIFSPSSYIGIGQTRSLPIFRRENTFEYVDNMSYTHGTHTLKWGVDFRRRQLTIYQTNQGNGRFNFSPALTDSRQPAGTGGDSMASFLLGYPTLIAHDYTQNWPGERGSEFGLYVADDWRVSKKLTLNLGLRWDYFSPFSEVSNRWANFNLATGKIDIAGRNGVDKYAGVEPFYKNFGPRFGFAYQLLSHTVIRGGFGLFYNPTGSEGGSMRLFRQLPFGSTLSISPGDINVGQRVSDGFPPLSPVNYDFANNPFGAMFAVDHGFRPSYAEQFNVTVEHEIAPWEMVIKTAAVGNLGRHLYNTYNANQAVPGSTSLNTRRPLYTLDPSLSDASYFTTDGLSEYYAFQLTVDKRFSHGLSAILGYAWSHAIDDVPLEFGGGAAGPQPQDPRNIAAERGNSIIDMRHRLTLSYTWELPVGKNKALLNYGGPVNWILGGWQTNGILTVQSGLPFTAVLQTSTTNTGTGSRPNAAGEVTYPRTLQHWFDTSAFSVPAPYTYGNLGRNTLFGPGRTNWDMSLFKNFVIHEQTRFELRAEAFNIFNHPQFGLPNANIGNPQAGSITSTVGNPRQLQMGLRFQF
ncbi:MAG TPA: TonB-dependent receptor [Bryobacteraceae bacterium]|nr:TonB-dependent receptor [Bryobacteraceae bacterium]